jgi:hypothetical protein
VSTKANGAVTLSYDSSSLPLSGAIPGTAKVLFRDGTNYQEVLASGIAFGVVANNQLIGNVSGGTAAPSAVTPSQANAILPTFTGDSGSGGVKGLVPAPSAGDAAAGRYLDSDGTWSVPPGAVSSVAGRTGAVVLDGTDVSFTQGGTGASARNVTIKSREIVSVKDFGATGDGSTNDQAAIYNALIYAQSVSGCVFFPSGTYVCATSINIQGSGPICFAGEGTNQSIILFTGSTAQFKFGDVTEITRLEIQNLSITTNQQNSSAAIEAYFERSETEMQAIIQNVCISGTDKTTKWFSTGIYLKNPAISDISNNFISGRLSTSQANITSSTADGIFIESTELSIIQRIYDNDVFYYENGIRTLSTGTIGIEGLIIKGNNTVHCVNGIDVRNADTYGYKGAQYIIVDNSTECFLTNIYGENLNEVWVDRNWTTGDATSVNSNYGVRLNTCWRVFVRGNTVEDGSGTANTNLAGVLLEDCQYGVVSDNVARTPLRAVTFSGTCVSLMERDNLQRGTGGRFKDISATSTNNSLPFQANVGYAGYTSNADLTAQIPDDDTIPQNTEGTQILSATITPKANVSKILVKLDSWATLSALGTMVAALFRDSGANAIQVASVVVPATNYYQPLTFCFLDAPNTTEQVTYNVRVGPTGGLTMRMNGSSTARRFGGASSATLTLTEVIQTS